ncbi:MAG: nucleotidyltransferase domain-containing protein [Candidatus Vogelbacteria bacterium]|nr:nucleotidyltransferase domain-containing protein [Candidatus Vogelbacteria bacterium]
MRLEYYDEAKLKREILEILGRHLNLEKYRVFFFGSRVAGGGDARSDIDLGIEGPEPVSAEAMLAIQEALEQLSTLYKVEVADFRRVGAGFKNLAKQNIELITQVNVKV